MSRRLSWSEDGTLAYSFKDGVRSTISATNKDRLDSDPAYTGLAGATFNPLSSYELAFNFPAAATIDKVAIAAGDNAETLSFKTSSDSTDGLDGTWSTVSTGHVTNANGQVIVEFPVSTPTAATWFKISGFSYGFSDNGDYVYKLFLFGEYAAPTFEFFDATESTELGNNYESLPSAGNAAAYSEYTAFKLKNVDSVTHSYTVTIGAMKTGGDSIVSTYFRLSDDDGASKVTSIDITDLTAGSFSAEIRVYCDISAAQNPADGYHYLFAKCTETA